MDDTKNSQRDVGAVVHAVQILRYLSATPHPLGVAVIARGTGINPSTCFAILRTLARNRFVAFRDSDKTYSLGMGISELATGLVGIRHAELIRPDLERLSHGYKMLVALWRITDDGHIVLIDRAHSATAVRVEMAIGVRLPSLIGAVGRCVGAAIGLPAAELRRRFGRLRWENAPSFSEYKADIAQARKRGWGLDEGQLYRGVNTIAAIVSDHDGIPRFGLSGIMIAGQHSRDLLEEIGEDLKSTTELIAAALFPPLPT